MSRARDLADLSNVINKGANLQPNLIINGDMAVSQRGTSETGITSDQYANAPDRYYLQMTGGGTWTASQSTTAPDGFSTSYKLDCTTANASPSSTNYLLIQQRVESQNLQVLDYGSSNAKKFTLSFYVRSNKTGTYVCEITHLNGAKYNPQLYTINTADTWEKKTLTFDGNTAATILNDNTAGLRISWWLMAGTNFTSGTHNANTWHNTTANRVAGQTVNLADSTSNEWYITGVSLVVGDTAPVTHPYESYAENLERCNRYYWKPVSQVYLRSNGYSANARYFGQSMAPPTIMRANPSVTLSNISYADANTAVAELTNANMLSFRAVASGDASNFAGFNIEVDAEL